MDLVDACIRWFDKRACDLEEMRWTWMNGGPTLAFVPSLIESLPHHLHRFFNQEPLCIHGTIIYCAGVLLKTCIVVPAAADSSPQLIPCIAVDCSM
jgi:hypothetical protein